jgi:ABC-type multidrug transport system ATPase subunit
MKQRLALAIALLPKPQFIILDEPTIGLDIEGVMTLRDTIQHLSGYHCIMFLIAIHMINEMERICNRIGIIYEGCLIRQGKVKQLLPEDLTLEQYYISAIKQEKEAVDHV